MRIGRQFEHTPTQEKKEQALSESIAVPNIREAFGRLVYRRARA
jgi:hypothetical protein